MKRSKLNYRFHNPNTAEVTARYIAKIFIEANEGKVEQAVQMMANELDADEHITKNRPA